MCRTAAAATQYSVQRLVVNIFHVLCNSSDSGMMIILWSQTSWSCSSCLSSWKWDSSLSLGEEVARDKGWSLSIVAPTNKTAPTSNDYYFLRETQIKMTVVFMMPKYFTFFSVRCFDIWCFPVWDVLMLLLPGRLSRAELINQRTTAQLSCQIGNNNGKRKRGIAKIQFSSLHFARIKMTRPDQTRTDPCLVGSCLYSEHIY